MKVVQTNPRLIEMLDKVLGQAKYAAAERRQLDIT
jgi:hypothetical protein